METIRQTLKVPKNHEVKIKIPDYVNENDSVEAIVIIGLEDNKKKIDELKEKSDAFVGEMARLVDNLIEKK